MLFCAIPGLFQCLSSASNFLACVNIFPTASNFLADEIRFLFSVSHSCGLSSYLEELLDETFCNLLGCSEDLLIFLLGEMLEFHLLKPSSFS